MNTPEPYELTIVTPGTGVGSNTAFSDVPEFISVYATLDVWIATTLAGTAAAGDGTAWKRIYVAANERRTIPWNGRGFWILNATGAQTPKVNADAWL